MSIAGKVRLSATLRSRINSELPVPLNSSKITSSMRLPVSISAVAMMVREPPSSMLRAAPKNRFGRCNALASTPRDRIEQDDDVAFVLDQALRFLDDHLGDLNMARGGLVEGRGNHLAMHRALHVGHFLGTLVDQEHDQIAFRVVGGDGVSDILQDHGL